MIVTIAEWAVILDTLQGTLGIHDRTDVPLFKYTTATRERLLQALTDRLNECGTTVSAGEKP